MPDLQFLRDYTERGSDSRMEHGEASIPTATWTTVVSFTANSNRVVTGFGADLIALLNAIYRFRLRLNGVNMWTEVANTTSVVYIPAELTIVAGDVVDIQIFHNEATANDAGASIAHAPA